MRFVQEPKMKMNRYLSIKLIVIMCCLSSADLAAQLLETSVSFAYTDWRLEDAIMDIGQTYDLQFVYSPDKIPVDELITVKVEEVRLQDGLDILLEKIPVKYQVLGQRIVLKPDKFKKIKSYTKLELPQPSEVSVRLPAPIDNTPREDGKDVVPTLDSITVQPSLELLLREKQKEIKQSGGNSFYVPQIDLSFLEKIDTGSKRPTVAQISIAPGMSTNNKAEEKVNRASLNLTWGVNGGVNGAEVGILGNTVRGDVQGAQIAGLVNTVDGNVTGTQVAGFINYTQKRTIGLQASLLGNYTGEGNGMQLGGFFNVVKRDYVGAQLALLFNATGGKNFGIQIAPGFNFAGDGRTQAQIGGLFNVAYDVQIAQIGGIVNAAHTVEGIQIGLINLADSVGVVSIGLLNFIKKGYNRFEVARGDVLKWNVAYKFGTKGFYNIVQVGLHSEDKILQKGKDNWSQENVSWAIGYGLGTSFKLNRRLRTNIELAGLHINEKTTWEKGLNGLLQGRLILDYRLGRKWSIFGGGTYNVLISSRFNRETGVYGSELPQGNIFFDKIVSSSNRENISMKMWLGFMAGVRF